MARWFAVIRHFVVFGLGTWIIVDALIDAVHTVPKLIIGMIMVGVLPIESFLIPRPVGIGRKESIDQPCKRKVES